MHSPHNGLICSQPTVSAYDTMLWSGIPVLKRYKDVLPSPVSWHLLDVSCDTASCCHVVHMLVSLAQFIVNTISLGSCKVDPGLLLVLLLVVGWLLGSTSLMGWYGLHLLPSGLHKMVSIWLITLW